jgi:hypothetical protein
MHLQRQLQEGTATNHEQLGFVFLRPEVFPVIVLHSIPILDLFKGSLLAGNATTQ